MYYLFKLLALLRRSRVFHPQGELYEGRITFDPHTKHTPIAKHFRSKKYVMEVRYSRGIGLPTFLPDFMGIALKIHADGDTQDFLLVSSGKGRITKYFLYPTFFSNYGYYTCGLPYKLAGKNYLFGLRARDCRVKRNDRQGLKRLSGDTYELVAAGTFGTWQKIAEINIGARLQENESRAIQYNPWNMALNVRPVSWLNALRKAAYSGSQDGRKKYSQA